MVMTVVDTYSFLCDWIPFLFPLQQNQQEEQLLLTAETGVDIGDICCTAESPQVGSKVHHKLAGGIYCSQVSLV